MVALPAALIEETEKLAAKVVALGSSEAAEAVVELLRDQIKRLDRERRAAALNQFAADYQSSLSDRSLTSTQAQDELYDDDGLPR